MKTITAASIQSRPVEQTYRTPPWGMLLLPLILLAIAAGISGAILTKNLPSFLWISVAILVPLVPLIIWASFIPSLRPTNWLLKRDGSRLYIMLRNFRNRQDDSEERLVIELEDHEIESVGRQTRKQSSITSDNSTLYWTEHFLEIVLREDPDTEIIEAWERERKHSQGRDGGTKRQPMFVRIDGRSIFLMWNGKSEVIRPGIGQALDQLGRNLQIHEPVVIDRPNLKEMTDEELDSKVLEFCESGHRMDAVQLLRKYRGYSLSEAKRMTDELC